MANIGIGKAIDNVFINENLTTFSSFTTQKKFQKANDCKFSWFSGGH